MAEHSGIIALITDFGSRDWYVAAMKGVILSIFPAAVLVDISHDIKAGKVRAGSFILEQCYREFPAETIFVAVVDPGVGTERIPVAVKADSRIFVGPDNGLFGFLTNRSNESSVEIRQITNTEFFKEKPSRTFHGRDIFAPAAAHLACGKSFSSIGPLCETLSEIRRPAKDILAGAMVEILHIDHFGNTILDFTTEEIPEGAQGKDLTIICNGRSLPFTGTYAEVDHGHALACFGSGGHLEIAVNGGNAAKHLCLKVGDKIEIKLHG